MEMNLETCINILAGLIAIITFISAIIAYIIEKRKIYLKQYGKLKREIDRNLLVIEHFKFDKEEPLTLDNNNFKIFANGLCNDVANYCLDTDFKICKVSRKILEQKLVFIIERINKFKHLS